MEIGQQINYKAVVSLGKLRFQAIPLGDTTNSKFCIKLLKRDHNDDYGTHNFYHLEIMINGDVSDIDIDSVTISPYITYNTIYYSSYRETRNYFILEGQLYKENFKQQFYLPQFLPYENVVYYIIYACIFLQKFQNLDKVSNIWDFLFVKERVTIGNSIDTINEFKDSLNDIAAEYPFMVDVINDALKSRIDKINEELQTLSFVKR